MTEIFEQVAAVSEQMMQNHLHKDELLLLQAMVLVNAGNYKRHIVLSVCTPDKTKLQEAAFNDRPITLENNE